MAEELDQVGSVSHLLAYRISQRPPHACVLDVPRDLSEVLSRYEVFRGLWV